MNTQNEVVQFAEGQQACREGRQCPIGAPEAFVRGYGFEYELGAIMDALDAQLEVRSGR